MTTGIYTHTTYTNGRLWKHRCTVTIVDETDKRYKIRIPYAIGTHAPGETMWVMRKSVKKSSEAARQCRTAQAQEKVKPDYSGAWWNK